MTTERPILFSAPMVRALLAGTKTQTRRPITVPPRGAFVMLDHGDGWWPYASDNGESALCNDGNEYPMSCQYGRPGDRLWVRETWGLHRPFDFSDWNRDSICGAQATPDDWELDYRSDWSNDCECAFWRPSIHMPRWASRILLEVTSVRVERLQEISEDDARAEGVTAAPFCKAGRAPGLEHVESFECLWDSINGKRAPWSSNPWLWVVGFKRIDTATEAA